MARLSLVQGVAYALHQEMERDERVLVSKAGSSELPTAFLTSSALSGSSIPRSQNPPSSARRSDWPPMAFCRWPRFSFLTMFTQALINY